MRLPRRSDLKRSLGATLVAPENSPLGLRWIVLVVGIVLEVAWVYGMHVTDAVLHPLAPVGAGVMFLGVVAAALAGTLVGLAVALIGVLTAFLLLADFSAGTGAANAIVAAVIWCGASLTTGLVAQYLRRQVVRRERELQQALGQCQVTQDVLERVLDFSPQFFEGETLREVTRTICESAIATFQADSSRIYSVKNGHLEMVAHSPKSEEIPAGTTLRLSDFPDLEQMLSLHRPSYVRDLRQVRLKAPAKNIRSALAIISTVRVPIIGPGGPVGVVSLGWDHIVEQPPDDLMATMQRFADQAAVAWQNALRLEAQRQADILHETLERLLKLAPTFHITGSREEVAQAVCQAALATFDSSACSLYEVEGDRLRVLDRAPPLQSLPRGRTFALSDDIPLVRDIRSHLPTFISDIDDPVRPLGPWPPETIRQMGSHSALYVPVHFTERGPQNLLVLTWDEPRERPDDNLLVVVERFADQMALALSNASAEQLHARLEASLLPTSPVEHPLLEVTTRYRTGEQRLRLGGDFVGSTVDASGELHFVIGDVSGHGPDAAALGATLRSTWKALSLAGETVPKTVSVMRKMLLADRREPHTFATILAGTIDPQEQVLSFVNAGHLPPLLVAAQVTSCDSLPAAPLGVDTDVERPLLRLPLPASWSLFCYTDGLIETRIAPGSSQRYGEDRLKKRLEAWVGTVPDGAAVDALMGEIETASGEAFADDVAVLLISTKEP